MIILSQSHDICPSALKYQAIGHFGSLYMDYLWHWQKGQKITTDVNPMLLGCLNLSSRPQYMEYNNHYKGHWC